MQNLSPFLLHWGVTAVSLWAASHIFRGLQFDGASSIFISALLLGFANAVIKPLLILLTLPLTLITFGLFVLCINALMLLLVARLVRGFRCNGFGTAFFAAIFVSLMSILIETFAVNEAAIKGGGGVLVPMPHSGVWL